ncbi:DNA primase [Artemisia annua]|uniref:DNA-directed primase/polymerase protein n=1 Tax=Artemisia annua TaxID=35608 RepID=A0A2U1Q4Y3_ARTAN|nr:DNA primase [Artemisia annua]
MDDADRLFECFKCGISPPESAARVRKPKKQKVNQEKQNGDPSTSTEKLSAGSSGRKQLSATNIQNFYTPIVGKKKLNNGSQFSPVVFYGSPQGVPPKRPSRLLRLLHEIRVELAAQHKSREDIWATFPRQDEAMKYAKDHVGVRIFSYQDHVSGQRRFLVSTYKEFWRRYKNMNCKFRHHYEVIQEGMPCHLYFDLEFNIKENAEKNGDEMVDLLILIIFEALLEKYSIEGDTNWIVELDSSTKDKFSRHLVICLPGIAFKDNTHVGAFVTEICSRIHSARERDKRFEQLFISKDSSSADVPCHLFIDTAVYSRNRCFRLHLSSKAGKNSVLLPTGRFKCKEMSEEDVFMVSLICNVGADCEKLLICKMDLDCIKVLHYDTERNSDYCKPRTREFVPTACTSDGYFSGKSPFPTLDEFIEFIATIGDVKGYRSPLRPVPLDALPDSYYKIEEQNGTQEFIHESPIDSCQKDEWWREATLVAEKVENMPRKLDLAKEHSEVWDEDDDWWLAAETTASQIELTYCGQA